MKNQNVSGNEIEQIGQNLMMSFFSTLVIGAIIIICVATIFVKIVKKQKAKIRAQKQSKKMAYRKNNRYSKKR